MKNDKKQKKLEARRKMLDKMLDKMEEKKVKDFADSIEELSFFLSRRIDPIPPNAKIDPIPEDKNENKD